MKSFLRISCRICDIMHTYNFLDTTDSSLYLVELPIHEDQIVVHSIRFFAFTTPRSTRSRCHRTCNSFSTSDDHLCRQRLAIRRPCHITRAKRACGFVVSDSPAVALRPLSVLDLGTDPEVSVDGGVGCLGTRGYAG